MPPVTATEPAITSSETAHDANSACSGARMRSAIPCARRKPRTATTSSPEPPPADQRRRGADPDRDQRECDRARSLQPLVHVEQPLARGGVGAQPGGLMNPVHIWVIGQRRPTLCTHHLSARRWTGVGAATARAARGTRRDLSAGTALSTAPAAAVGVGWVGVRAVSVGVSGRRSGRRTGGCGRLGGPGGDDSFAMADGVAPCAIGALPPRRAPTKVRRDRADAGDQQRHERRAACLAPVAVEPDQEVRRDRGQVEEDEEQRPGRARTPARPSTP